MSPNQHDLVLALITNHFIHQWYQRPPLILFCDQAPKSPLGTFERKNERNKDQNGKRCKIEEKNFEMNPSYLHSSHFL